MEFNTSIDTMLFNETFCNISVTDNSSGACPHSHAAGATIVSPMIMFMAGIFGNVLALFTLNNSRTDVRSTKFYTLVTGLAWTDLMGILMTSPSVILAYVNKVQWVGGMTHCHYHGFAMTCFGLATPLIICAMSIERFLALKCVFFYSLNCKRGTARGLVLVLWLLVVLYGIMPMFGFGKFEMQYPNTWCFLNFHSKDIQTKVYAYIYSIFNLLLLVVMLACNMYVMSKLCYVRFKRIGDDALRSTDMTEKNRMLTTHRSSSVVSSKQSNVETQMIALMFALTFVFVICWAPLMIQIITTLATGRENRYLDLTAIRLASLNQTLDPWLYIIVRRSLITSIRKCFRRTLRRLGVKSEDKNEDCINIIAQKSNSGGHIDNRNICKNNPGILIQKQPSNIFSQPDIMHGNSNNTRLQLPDVTNTNHSDYVCQLHFGGNRSTGNDDDGIYVKISFLSQQSEFSGDSKSASDCICDLNRTHSCPDPQKRFPVRITTRYSTEQTKTTDLVTKETSSGEQSANWLSPHSETLPDVIHTDCHQSLRKTRSTS